jgi:hypothetical protein
MRHTASGGRAALLLIAMAFLAYSYWIPRGPLANSDTRIAQTRAIVDDHTLFIDRYAADLVDRSAYRGHFYSDKAPGVSLLAVPVYASLRAVLPAAFFSDSLFFMVRYLLTVAVVGLPSALFVGLMWRFLLPLAGRRGAALLSAGYALGTMTWALSALLYSHVLAAICVFGAFMLLYRPARTRRPVGPGRMALAGLLCGLSVCLEYPAGLVAAVLAVYAVALAWRATTPAPWTSLAAFFTAAAAGVAPVPLMNLAEFGNALSQGYAHLHGAAQFRNGMGHGVEGVGLPDLSAFWGITFSPYRGLFFLSPFLLLAVPGLAYMWRRRSRRPAAAVCASAAVLMLVFNSSYYFWDGGVSLGPRHFMPALPFLMVPVACALRRQPWRRLAPWLVGISIAIVGLCCTTVLIFLPGILNPVVDLALYHLLHGPTPNNWGLLLGLRGEASLLPLIGGELVLALALVRLLRPARSRLLQLRRRAERPVAA